MSEPKWTAGKWKTKRARFPEDGEYNFAVIADIGGKNHCIAEVFGRSDYEVRPPALDNAHLIASAPQLYEALDTLIKNHDPETGSIDAETNPTCPECTGGVTPAKFDRGPCALHRAEAALKKALGGS